MRRLRIEMVMLIAGVAVGVIVTMSTGAGGNGSNESAGFAVSVAADGFALVRTDDGSLYVVDAKNGMAMQVLYSTTITGRRDNKGIPLSLGGLQTQPSEEPAASRRPTGHQPITPRR